SIKLLQLPQLELSQKLDQELMENPLLEEDVERESDVKAETTEIANSEEQVRETPEDAEAPLEKIFGFTSDDYFEERGSDGRDLGYFTDGIETPSPFERNSKKMDIYEHVLWQLRLSRMSDPVRQVAEIVIGNLDDDGYLRASNEEIAGQAEVDLETAGEAVELIRGLDPPGVGARNLRECLLLQLKPLNLTDTLVEKILTEGFDELERKKYKKLAAGFRVSLDDILTAVSIIEGLEPRPGRNYSRDEVIHIIPDVYVEEVEGKFNIILNDEGIPRLRLSNYYRKLLANKKNLGEKEKEFLEEKLRSAVWLLKSLDQRKKTIYRVTDSILKFQEEFFSKGLNYLKPLNLKDIALDLGMHESTISRVTSNKYLQCPRGLFNFRFFLSSGVHAEGGDISSATVKEIMKRMISGEDPKSPLNDQQIVETLGKSDIKIARRTVAKYRDELKIPSHSRRKKWT
ncbi:MAG TPA: RNA polymerase sigma-54 factor, partial [Nitrospirae bacterium]|nr:RNA polymerase sigma-54 factor [Nitrospirota bacterium]